MTDIDMEQPVKVFMNQTIAFKAFMNISVCVEGRGQSYNQQMQVDPMDQLERTMKQKTHFWKTFMCRGTQRCMVVLHHKSKEASAEPDFVHPDSMNDTFRAVGATDKCQITLVEVRGRANNELDSDMDEGGEEDLSDQFNEEEAEENKDEEPQAPEATKIVEQDADIPEKKASDVLFECESDDNKDK